MVLANRRVTIDALTTNHMQISHGSAYATDLTFVKFMQDGSQNFKRL